MIASKVLCKRAYRIILFLNDAHHSHSSNGLLSSDECPGDHCSLLQLLLTAVYNPHYQLLFGTSTSLECRGRADWHGETLTGREQFRGTLFSLSDFYSYALVLYSMLPSLPPPQKGYNIFVKYLSSVKRLWLCSIQLPSRRLIF